MKQTSLSSASFYTIWGQISQLLEPQDSKVSNVNNILLKVIYVEQTVKICWLHMHTYSKYLEVTLLIMLRKMAPGEKLSPLTIRIIFLKVIEYKILDKNFDSIWI